ncbi:toxin-antitoxin system YwqK family antitoxin [Flavisolibacter tropicus]|uniref:toxin-antitoxin system YwqK family antitoxin n=1 Tax=Flavisolibacter tropicus TaxID=1492898 RepID=UPI00131432A5|nr:hypothetical protein [Flavisolibacter tropicus]
MTTSTKQEWHPNGQLKEEIHYNGSLPANGWSYKSYYPNSQLEKEQCFSKGQLIEQKTFDENGNKTSHTIWNIRLQQMVDRPVVTPASQTIRPNVASGCMTIASIIEIMPWVCELIEAPVMANELGAAHDRFYSQFNDDKENEAEEERDEEAWRLKGKKGSLSVLFERSEGYLFYHIHTPDNNDYVKANQLVARAQNRNRLDMYFTEEELLLKATRTATPILYYITPFPRSQWLEFELNVWGTDPVYTLLSKAFTLARYSINIKNDSVPPVPSFLESLPYWNTIIKEIKESDSAFYIIHAPHSATVPIVKNPTPKELERFLQDHRSSQ